MKTYLLLASIFVVSFTNCTNEEIKTENTEIQNFSTSKNTADPAIGQILKIIYNNNLTDTKIREIRKLYFDNSYTGDSFSGSQYYYVVEMYDVNLQNSHVEYWRIISSNEGKPGGIGGGMPDEVIIEY